jgi:hypothetical protein
MVVAIVGTRPWKPGEVASWPRPTELQVYVWMQQNLVGVATKIVSGAARGPDRWGAKQARVLGIPVEEFPAKWRTERGYNPAAGMERNSDIVAAADWVVAFWDGHSKGTLDTITKAHAAGKRVTVVWPDGRTKENR